MLIKSYANLLGSVEVPVWKKVTQNLTKEFHEMYKVNPNIKNFKVGERKGMHYQCSYDIREFHNEVEVNSLEELEKLLKSNYDMSLYISNGEYWLDYE